MMKFVKYTHLFLLLFLFACEGDNINNNNPFLPNFSFQVTINTSFPLYSPLQFPGNAVIVNEVNAGILGLVVFNSGSVIFAYDLACPNQTLSSCSTMTLQGIEVKCPCDEATYNLFTGLPSNPQLRYPLRRYRVEVAGATIRIFN
ncbi:MAG: Rieske (2Fe-2S) protein [Flavobacterium sp.]